MDPHFDGVIFTTYAQELRRRLRYPHPPFRVLDVRPREEYRRGHIPGALSVPDGARGALPEGAPPRIETFVVGSGPDDPAVRAASLALQRLGAHRIVELTNGMFEWTLAGFPTEASGAEGAEVPQAA